MTRGRKDYPSGENRLLAALPEQEYERLLPRLETVPTGLKETLLEPGRPIPYVYFPRCGVFSVLITMEDGHAIEVGTVGHEGMVGLPVFLGADRSPAKVFCQVVGEADRMEAGAFREEAGWGGALHDLMRRYTQAVLNQIAQSVACNHLHSVEERMCRWLLMTHDRVGGDEFPMTHEFLSQMLGVRRASVTIVAGIFQKAGLIAYHRGTISILDRAGLEAASCECYHVVRREFDRLLG
jgi:CRP-like cAMP-binding protein